MFVKLLSEQLGYWLGMTVLFGKFYDGFKASLTPNNSDGFKATFFLQLSSCHLYACMYLISPEGRLVST